VSLLFPHKSTVTPLLPVSALLLIATTHAQDDQLPVTNKAEH